MKRIFVVGFGPGSMNGYTIEALNALESSEIIYGYKTYTDLVKKNFPGREYIVSGMHEEKERCKAALEKANEDHTVSIVSSGDAGVYGMASLLLEMAKDYPDVEVNIVSGVTAALSGAARLGSPLGHDFVVISLSDLLTPWDVIEKRLKAAATGDFVTVLYNPGSHTRTDALEKACDIMLSNGRSPETVCGVVKNIDREGQERHIMTLEKLKSFEADMLTTVFIGSSETKVIGEKMVTPRGYKV